MSESDVMPNAVMLSTDESVYYFRDSVALSQQVRDEMESALTKDTKPGLGLAVDAVVSWALSASPGKVLSAPGLTLVVLGNYLIDKLRVQVPPPPVPTAVFSQAEVSLTTRRSPDADEGANGDADEAEEPEKPDRVPRYRSSGYGTYGNH